jgi:hypothetical protein
VWQTLLGLAEALVDRGCVVNSHLCLLLAGVEPGSVEAAKRKFTLIGVNISGEITPQAFG